MLAMILDQKEIPQSALGEDGSRKARRRVTPSFEILVVLGQPLHVVMEKMKSRNIMLACKFRGFISGARSLKKGLKAANSSSTTARDKSVGLHCCCRFKIVTQLASTWFAMQREYSKTFYISCSCFNV